MMGKYNKYFKGTESYTPLDPALVAEFGQVQHKYEQEPLLTEVLGELRPTTRPYTATECLCLEPVIESGIQISNGGLVHKDYCSTCELEVVGRE